MNNLIKMTDEHLKDLWKQDQPRITKGPNKGVMTKEAIQLRDSIMKEWKRRGYHLFDLG